MASQSAHEDKEEAPEDWRSNCSSHSAQMSYALEHGVLSDVSFLVGDSKEVIRGHRSILSIGSPVFQSLLTGKSIDENPIEIQDVQPNGFKHLLKYLYTGEIREIPDEDYPEFFRAVKYFTVRRLYPIYKESILKHITTGNALKAYEDGKLLKEKDLEDTADTFIKKNAEAILAEPKFLKLSLDNLLHFISSDDFSAKEISICLAVFKWGQAECDRQKLEKTHENVLSMIKNIIPQIRFPLMDPEDFALKIAPLNLLTLKEHVALLTYFIMPQNKREISSGDWFISKPRQYYQPPQSEPQNTPEFSRQPQQPSEFIRPQSTSPLNRTPQPPNSGMNTPQVQRNTNQNQRGQGQGQGPRNPNPGRRNSERYKNNNRSRSNGSAPLKHFHPYKY